MTLDEFRKDLLESVRDSAEAKRNLTRVAYVEEVGNRLVEAEEFTDFQLCSYVGVGTRNRRLQVDAYSYDEMDNSLSLLIADFNYEGGLTSFGATEANKLFGMLRNFLEEALSGNVTDGSPGESAPGYGLATDISQWQPNVARYRLYLVSDRQLNTRTKDWPEESIGGVPTEFHIWDIARFHVAYESATGRDDLEIDFTKFGSGLACLKAGSARGEYEGYLCMIPGKTLAGVYERYGSRLLEGNVRSFLSAKGKVNSGIQATIRSMPEMFFAYNNGVTATAEDVILENRKNGLFITHATNLQIVNGAQTTASLAFAKRKDGADLSEVFVQMKLAVLPPEKADQLIPDIARFANSQNKVSDADFFSNHPYHVRIEEFSRRIWTPSAGGAQHGTHWFYERARGQYLNEQSKLTKAQRTQFQLQNPKRQVLSKTDIAKLENTWRGMPHKVSLGAQKNFMLFADWIAKRWKEDDSQFHEEYFKELVARAILFRHSEELVSTQPWYQGGYRANVVTYALAKLHDMVLNQGKGRRLDLRYIWDRQSVPSAMTAQLVCICKYVFEVLTDPSRPKENVTEWAKIEGCWDRVQTVKIPFEEAFYAQLTDGSVARRVQKEAAANQQIDNGIAIQSSVVGIAGRKWAEICAWGEKQGLLNVKDIELLRVASMIPVRLPSEKQCQLIWAIRSRLVENGLPA